MNKKKNIIIGLVGVGVVVFGAAVATLGSSHKEHKNQEELAELITESMDQEIYACPMHPEIQSHEHGDNCSICGMSLVKVKRSTVTLLSNEISAEDSSMAHNISPIEGSTEAKHIAPNSGVMLSGGMINKLGVRTEPVTLGELRKSVDAPGFIQQINEEGLSRYDAPAQGMITNVFVKEFDWVEKGDALYEWMSPALNEKQQFFLQLVSSEQQNADKNTEHSNERLLALSKKQLKKLGLNDHVISQLEQTGKPIEKVTVVANRPGRVLKLGIKNGAKVDKSQLLMTVGGIVRATILANVFQRDAVWIQAGQEADIRLQGKGPVFKAVVTQGAVSINPNSQNIGVRLSFMAPLDKIRQSMYVEGRIFDTVRANSLSVPLEAVIWDPSGDRVIRSLGDGRFEPVIVEPGIEADGRVEILSGLNVNDEIVTSAQFMIDSESSLALGMNRLSYSEQQPISYANTESAMPMGHDHSAHEKLTMPMEHDHTVIGMPMKNDRVEPAMPMEHDHSKMQAGH